jgi:hypothetical protein
MTPMPTFHGTNENTPLKNFYFLDYNILYSGKITERPRMIVEKDKRKEKALERHARLSRLFKEDRFAFERERKRMIDEVISRAGDEKLRESLRALQESWDRKMRGAGSAHNRFILAQEFFWEHFHQTWQPSIQKLNAILNGRSDRERSK